MKKTLFLILLLTTVFGAVAQENTYRNPVIRGDFPDPSVIRVGDTYYVASSSSEWGEPYRLFQSKDLINWESLGGIFREVPDWLMGSFWAPELFYKDGTYYVYYTARRKSDRKSYIGVATTQDITQGFTDHGLLIEWTNEAIDAYVIELDGKLYITWKAYGLDSDRNIQLLCSEMTPDGLSLKGDVWTLLEANTQNWERGGIEGQALVKKGDYIYLFYAGAGCCGRGCDYKTGVARAKDIRGPWAYFDGNPILEGDDYWMCSGHGTLVETTNGKYFYMYHAYNAQTNVYTGREGMMDEVLWDEATGWPYFRYGRTPSLQAEVPFPGTKQDVKEHCQAADMQWLWDVHHPKAELTIDGQSLTLAANNTSVGAFRGFRVQKGNYLFQASLSPQRNAAAGICLYGSDNQSVGLSVGETIELWIVNRGERSVLETVALPAEGAITICLQTTFGQYCQFGYKDANGRFKRIGGEVHVSELLNWDRPPVLGVQAKGQGSATFNSTTIDYGVNARARW